MTTKLAAVRYLVPGRSTARMHWRSRWRAIMTSSRMRGAPTRSSPATRYLPPAGTTAYCCSRRARPWRLRWRARGTAHHGEHALPAEGREPQVFGAYTPLPGVVGTGVPLLRRRSVQDGNRGGRGVRWRQHISDQGRDHGDAAPDRGARFRLHARHVVHASNRVVGSRGASRGRASGRGSADERHTLYQLLHTGRDAGAGPRGRLQRGSARIGSHAGPTSRTGQIAFARPIIQRSC